MRSWTRNVSLAASCRIRPANLRTASASSAASSIVSASRASAPTGVLSSWLTLATKSLRTSSTRRLSVWSSASTQDEAAAADRPRQRGDADREGGGPAAEARHRHLELGLADLSVTADLARQGEQLAHHQPVALDDPERAGRGAGAQHAVFAVHDDRGRGKHGQDRGNARRQLRRLLGGPQARASRLPHSGAIPCPQRHVMFRTSDDAVGRADAHRCDQSILTYLMVCGRGRSPTIGRLREISLFSGCSPGRLSSSRCRTDKSNLRERPGGQRPWFLTASAAATAASGSRYRPPGGSGRDDASSS